MCLSTRKVEFVCTLGDLKPGERFRDPQGWEWLVTDATPAPGDIIVANILTGRVTPMYASTRLGKDLMNRYYAARGLNGWYYTPDSPVPGAVTELEKEIDDLARKLTDKVDDVCKCDQPAAAICPRHGRVIDIGGGD